MPASSADSSAGRPDSDVAGDLFRLVIENVVDYAIFALDREGVIRTWNPGAERMKGYTAAEIIGRHFSIFYPEPERSSGKPERELEIAAAEGRFEEEGWRRRRDGTEFWANVVISALRAETGELVGFAKVTRDLTERRDAMLRELDAARRLAAEEAARAAADEQTAELADLLKQLSAQAAELELRRRQAEQANRAKSRFLAAISHELRTPLNAIGGYVDLLLLGLRGPLTELQKHDLERVLASQQRLLAQINDLLDIARIEAGRLAFNIQSVAVADVLHAVLPLIAPDASARNISVEVPAALDLRVCADADRLHQILLNLLANAVRFTPPGGRVRVSCTRQADKVIVAVADTGPGIPADQTERIFEPFTQLDTGITNMKGAGLGLAISRELARGMGGDLTVRSEPAHGAEFLIRLPFA